jgi:hypothetical protein
MFISDSLNARVNELSLKSVVGHSLVLNVAENVYGHVSLSVQKEVLDIVDETRRNRTISVQFEKKEKH